jgi:glycosyltransferase involved in cell wall biosynthesis
LKKKAIIASDIPGNREVVENNKNGFLVDIMDYPTFAEKVVFLSKNQPELRRLAEHNDDFTAWDGDGMVELQAELYRHLLSKFRGKFPSAKGY